MTEQLEVLFDADSGGVLDAGSAGGPQEWKRAARTLPARSSLAAFYGGPLRIPLHDDRPTIVANFVSTLDGVVSFGDPGASGGSAVSGGSEEDHRLMGLIRTLGDAVMVGAGTVRRARGEEWTARDIDPELAPEQARIRRELGLAAQPTTVVVSASGELDREQRGLATMDVPVLVATTARGARAFGAAAASERIRIASLGAEDVAAAALVTDLHRAGMRLVVCEGGPHLLGGLFRAGVIDELFLTVAPRIAGRADGRRRLALVEAEAFDVATAPWSSLVSVRRAGDHLFLRYRFDRSGKGTNPQ
jgi:riboflavin biosynthesis pyrimidine reductase